ncbi:MAG TPA: M2 family metallopeptidase [Gammaproteobacteria bacterium]
MKQLLRITGLIAALLLAACGNSEKSAEEEAAAQATVSEADAFVEEVNTELAQYQEYLGKAQWIASTYITDDAQFIAAAANEDYLTWLAETIEASKRFNALDLTGDTARAMQLIKTYSSMPAPSAPEKVAELARIAAELEAMYGAGKYCPEGEDGKCYTLGDLEHIIDDPDASYEEKLMAWTGWRTVSSPMQELYKRFVELTNEGAKELGYEDTGAMWRSAYDMPPEAFAAELDRLWGQVEPLYNALHCYVRDELQQKYGEEKVPTGEPIPAHLLGNMWAQEWGNIYPIVEPFPGVSDLNVTQSLVEMRSEKADELVNALGSDRYPEDIVEAQRQADEYIALEMVKSAENFYTSLGMQPLPDSFWNNAMFIEPRDRDVVCHASAWDMDAKGDVRIKMCIEPVGEDLTTIYHELGHVYYYLAYNDQETIFQNAAHDGFHEAIGDTIELAMTPEYLASQGFVDDVTTSEEAVINRQMKMALNKVAFLPFGKLIDQWRWKVFAGEIPPERYNDGWWELREKYQGVQAPVPRSEADFDPGSKYHIPANVPYTRYFLARILQFQFYKALCDAAGHEGPLYQCSFYGSEEAGKRFQAMMENGASQPWQETLFELTGTREMSGEPLLEYFEPLQAFLEEKNQGKQCGW